MDTTPQILVVGTDPLLRGEFESAVQRLRRWKPVLHFVRSARQAVEVARNRRPDIACLQIEGDARGLQDFSEEIASSAPGCAVAALYRPEQLAHGESQPTVLINAMRAEVQDFLRRPLTGEELQQLLDRVLTRPAEVRREMGRTIAFVSNKGGVGKSTLSVSVACELARRSRPGSVLLLDVSIHLGSCAPMLDLQPPTTLAHAARERHRLDETLLRKLTQRHECGLDLLAAPIDAVEASEIDDDALSRVLTLARRTYDWVVVDTFPMLDGLVMAVLDLSDRAYVVVQNTVPNVVGAAHLLPVLGQIGFPTEKTHVVLNNNFERVAGTPGVADVEERLQRSVDHVIPYQKRLVTALNVGRPYVLHGTRVFGFGRSIRRMVDELEGEIPSPNGWHTAPAPHAAAGGAESSTSEGAS